MLILVRALESNARESAKGLYNNRNLLLIIIALGMSRLYWGPAYWFIDASLLCLSSCGERGKKKKSGVSSVSELIPFMRAPPSLPNHPPACRFQIFSLRKIRINLGTWIWGYWTVCRWGRGILNLSVSFSEQNPPEWEWSPFKAAAGFILIRALEDRKKSLLRKEPEEVGKSPANGNLKKKTILQHKSFCYQERRQTAFWRQLGSLA